MHNIIVAAAGAGKTTRIVNDILKQKNQKTLVVTYTLNNVQEIKNKFYELNGSIPEQVFITSWFSFLLRDVVRPYQNYIYEKRIESIAFIPGRSTKGIAKSNFKKYFLNQENKVYMDKISELGIMCNDASKGLVIERLESLYKSIYIDEVQDLAGYDLDLLEVLFKSKVQVFLVGDHRQATYQTNYSTKNSKYAGVKIINKFEKWKKEKICNIEYSNISHRCNQAICDLADSLYPEFQKTTSQNNTATNHDGVFLVSPSKIKEYMAAYNPTLLRYDRKANCLGFEDSAINWGDSKGLTFDRVLIILHGPATAWLKTKDFNNIAASIEKLYVAITRAKFSVSFLYDGACAFDFPRFE